MKYSFNKIFALLIILNFGVDLSFAQELSKDELLFKTYCKSCHELGRELTGPDLSNINETRTNEWLIRFIRDSKTVISSGDETAIMLFNDYKKVEMPPNNLTDIEINLILNYIEKKAQLKDHVVKNNIVLDTRDKELEHPKMPIFLVVSLVLTFILLIAFLISRANYRNKKDFKKHPFLMRFQLLVHLSKWTYFVLFSFLAVINFSSAKAYFKNKQLFSQSYDILQPVEFSHEVHFDTYKIDCIYCHVMAVSSNIANLPSNENCIKCHDYIRKGEKTGEAEIAKLLKYKNSNKNIEWTKGYRLKKHVHFNHLQHTSAGKLNCINCHKNTSRPEIYQPNVSMKWCIDCHKKSEIENRSFYYSKSIDTLLLIGNTKVSDLGGIDCSNCHY